MTAEALGRATAYRRFLGMAGATLALDQATKAWIAHLMPLGTYGEAAGAIPVVRGFCYLVHQGNTGAAWSILTGRSLALAAVAALTLAAIFLARHSIGLRRPPVQWAFGLLCGGIAGNLVDRIARGHVLDFVDLHFGRFIYPTFNVADSAICVGVGLYLILSLRAGKA